MRMIWDEDALNVQWATDSLLFSMFSYTELIMQTEKKTKQNRARVDEERNEL